jgi:hypothetical protein
VELVKEQKYGTGFVRHRVFRNVWHSGSAALNGFTDMVETEICEINGTEVCRPAVCIIELFASEACEWH